MAGFSKTYLISSVAVILATASSCIYDSSPLCPEEKVEITICNDWNGAPDATPEGMAYLFFMEGLSSPWRFDFPGREAGKVSLSAGDYRFVMFNDDTSDIVFDKDSEGIPLATTHADSGYTEGIADNVRQAPDMMWSASIRKVMVSEDRVEYTSGDSLAGGNGSYKIITEPVQITPQFRVKVLKLENLQGVSAMKGVITGMASGINLFERSRKGPDTAVSFSPEICADSTVRAVFNTFGRPDGLDVRNYLKLCFLLSDGRIVCEVYDVTAKILAAPDPMRIELVIDSISLPYAPPAGSGGAFDPQVAGWITVVVNYEVWPDVVK